MATCKGCGDFIIWVKIRSDKSIPCDPDPLDDDSGAVAVKRLDSGVRIGYVVSARRPLQPGYWSYTPHHATCKKVDQFRPPKPIPQTDSLF